MVWARGILYQVVAVSRGRSELIAIAKSWIFENSENQFSELGNSEAINNNCLNISSAGEFFHFKGKHWDYRIFLEGVFLFVNFNLILCFLFFLV